MKLPKNIQTPRKRPKAKLYLDANESPFNAPLNKYPSEAALSILKQEWGKHERIPERCIYFCNGTEEAVDLLLRTYALPTRDSIVIPCPTRTVYKRRAMVNRVECREAQLKTDDFELDADNVVNCISSTTKLLFLCNPNSPTGNSFKLEDVEVIIQLFEGMVVIDESYIEFSQKQSAISLLNKYKNVVLIRSFSHAWSCAGLQLACIVAHPEAIAEVSKVGFAHPLNSVVMEQALQKVRNRLEVDKCVRQILDERTKVIIALSELPECVHIYPSDANFILVRFKDSAQIYKYLIKEGIAVFPVQGCLRITIGIPSDNSALLGALRRRIKQPTMKS